MQREGNVFPLSSAVAQRGFGTKKGAEAERQALLRATPVAGSEYVRQAAVRVLGQIGDARSVEPLVATLGDSDSGVRLSTVQVLKQIGGTRVVEALIAASMHHFPYVRLEMVQALGKIRDVRVVEPLAARLKDDNPMVRMLAAESLGNTAEELMATINTGGKNQLTLSPPKTAERQVKEVDSLKALSAARSARLKLAEQQARAVTDAREIVDKIRNVAVSPLLTAIQDKDVSFRQAAIKALGSIRDVRAVESLVAMLKDSDPNLQVAAAKALGEIKDAGAIEFITPALGSCT